MADSSDRDLGMLVRSIYDAVDDERGFHPLATQLVRAFGSHRLHLLLLDEHKIPLVQGWDAIDLTRNSEEDVQEYLERWNAVDPRFHVGLVRMGEVHSDVDVIEPIAFERSMFRNEFLRGIGQRYSMFTTTPVMGGNLLGFAFMRPEHRGHYRAEERELATELAPHLGRAMRVRALLDAARERSATFEATLDRLPLAVALVDAEGNLRFVNAEARALLDVADGVRVDERQLSATRPCDAALLHSAIEEVACYVERGARANAAPSRSVRVMRSDASFGMVSLFPIASASALRKKAPRARVLCIFYDPSQSPLLDPHQLRAVFNLTPVECELANALVQGRTLADFAARRGTGVETVRTQVKRLLSKTDSRTQADFVRQASLMLALRMTE